VAEAPPQLSSGRFFYYEDVKEKDGLFLEMMKCLYPKEAGVCMTSEIRKNKPKLLNKFQQDGFYLIDSCDYPMPENSSRKQKENLVREAQPTLLHQIKTIARQETKVILIAAPVFSVNYLFLKANKINVINSEMIDFPGSGAQQKFQRKMSALLSEFATSSRG